MNKPAWVVFYIALSAAFIALGCLNLGKITGVLFFIASAVAAVTGFLMAKKQKD